MRITDKFKIWFLASVLSGAAASAAAPTLHLYLPRIVRAGADPLALGRLAVVHSSDAALARKATRTTLGPAPKPGQTLTFTRRAILDKLAARGIQADQVSLRGAREVTVRRPAQVIGAQQIIRTAEAFLKTRPTLVAYRPIRIGQVKPLALPAEVIVEPKPRLAANPPAGHTVVEVHFRKTRDGRTVASANVFFRHTRQLSTPPKAPALAATTRPVASATPVGKTTPAATTRPAPRIDIQKGKRVKIRIRGPGFTITAKGEALDAGGVGRHIRVRNTDTGAVITGKIGADGVVEATLN